MECEWQHIPRLNKKGMEGESQLSADIPPGPLHPGTQRCKVHQGPVSPPASELHFAVPAMTDAMFSKHEPKQIIPPTCFFSPEM